MDPLYAKLGLVYEVMFSENRQLAVIWLTLQKQLLEAADTLVDGATERSVALERKSAEFDGDIGVHKKVVAKTTRVKPRWNAHRVYGASR